MAEVLILPIALTLEGVERLRDELEDAVREGAELGSRRSQIACLSASLALSLEQLRGALPAAIEESGLDGGMAAALVEAAARVTRLARLVDDFAEACAGRPRE